MSFHGILPHKTPSRLSSRTRRFGLPCHCHNARTGALEGDIGFAEAAPGACVATTRISRSSRDDGDNSSLKALACCAVGQFWKVWLLGINASPQAMPHRSSHHECSRRKRLLGNEVFCAFLTADAGGVLYLFACCIAAYIRYALAADHRIAARTPSIHRASAACLNKAFRFGTAPHAGQEYRIKTDNHQPCYGVWSSVALANCRRHGAREGEVWLCVAARNRGAKRSTTTSPPPVGPSHCPSPQHFPANKSGFSWTALKGFGCGDR